VVQPREYKQLYEATREYSQKSARTHYRWNAEQVHDTFCSWPTPVFA